MAILESVAVVALMGGVFGSVLAIASKKLAVETDSRIDEILEVLPGANCGACGFPGCAALAQAIVENGISPSVCAVSKAETIEKIASIMGFEVGEHTDRKVVRIRCSQPLIDTKKIYEYQGISDCHLAVNLFKGQRSCNFGCFGLGSCAKSCPFGAITMSEEGMPQFNYDICTGCGVCVNECPQFLLYLEKSSQQVLIGCNNLDRGKAAKDVCPSACISCGICAKTCPQNAIEMVTYKNGGSLPLLDSAKCTQCGACIEKCPSKCISFYSAVQGDVPVLPKEEKTGCDSCGTCFKN